MSGPVSGISLPVYPADAVIKLDQALALWRGEVLADLAAARTLWRQAEHKIVTAAPIVPTVVELATYLTSARARNVEVTPSVIPAFDQAWVK
jgi:hypothetical protein